MFLLVFVGLSFAYNDSLAKISQPYIENWNKAPPDVGFIMWTLGLIALYRIMKWDIIIEARPKKKKETAANPSEVLDR